MTNRFSKMWLIALTCLGMFSCLGKSSLENGTQEIEPQDSKSEEIKERKARWQDQFPVSMNGKPPTLYEISGSDLTLFQLSNESEFLERFWHDHLPTLNGAEFYRRRIKPEAWFTDPKVVGLCHAIFAKDVPTMERLIGEGADVNATGPGNINLLILAYLVSDDPRPFDCLLNHGADPNIVAKLDQDTVAIWHFNMEQLTVSHLVARRRYNRLFKKVFESGGDPKKKIDKFFGDPESTSPFHMLKSSVDLPERIKLLVEKGGDLNDGNELLLQLASVPKEAPVPGMKALLEVGVDPTRSLFQVNSTVPTNQLPKLTYPPSPYQLDGCYFRAIHFLAFHDEEFRKSTAETRSEYLELLKDFDKQGEHLETAKADLVRWKNWVAEDETSLIRKEHREWLSKRQNSKPKE